MKPESGSTDYPTCEATFATLRIYLEVRPGEITEKLWLQPTRTARRGDQPPGRRVPFPVTSWLLSSKDVVESLDLEKHLDWIITKLEPRADALRELQNRGAKTDLFCYWQSKYGHGGPTLSPEIMKRAAALGLEIGFDVYFTEADIYSD